MEKLPEEILFNIFKHLPQKDLLSLNCVCKVFGNTIDQFHLIEEIIIGGHSKNESSTPHRVFAKSTIKSYTANIHQKVLEIVGRNLKKLHFSQSSLSLLDIITILQLTPNLKSLKFDYVRLIDDTIDSTVSLPQLKNVDLVFSESDPNIFRVFQQSSMLKIDLRFFGDTPYSNFAEFVAFMNQQNELKSLAISGVYESNLFLISMERSQFQLEELIFDNCDFEEWEKFESFLMEHVKTLTSITVKKSKWDPSSILNHCVTLKTLHVQQANMNFLNNLASVEELSIETAICDITKFPNIKRLLIANTTPKINEDISASMKHLEDLEIKYGESLSNLYVPQLKKLKIMSFNASIDPAFFLEHRCIDALTISCFTTNDVLLDAITNSLTNLKVLRILGINQLTSATFKIIVGNCKKLKVFEMTKWCQKFHSDELKCLNEIVGLKTYVESFV